MQPKDRCSLPIKILATFLVRLHNVDCSGDIRKGKRSIRFCRRKSATGCGGFYIISRGTTANFLTANPTNNSNGSAVALFSLDAANPSKINHFRWYTPDQSATDPTALELHIMDKVFGKESDFDDLTMGIDFTA